MEVADHHFENNLSLFSFQTSLITRCNFPEKKSVINALIRRTFTRNYANNNVY